MKIVKVISQSEDYPSEFFNTQVGKHFLVIRTEEMDDCGVISNEKKRAYVLRKVSGTRSITKCPIENCEIAFDNDEKQDEQ